MVLLSLDEKKKSVAIIGSGPAGYVAATTLVKENFEVTIFDELQEFGGMLAYGIPEFRIPLNNVRERISKAKNQGIIFVQKRISSLKGLLKKNKGKFDYVLLCVGSGNGSVLEVNGKEKKGIYDAIDFLLQKKFHNKELVSQKDTVAIIGGGNSAIDSARVAQKIGAKVTIVYRRTEKEMPAMKKEIEEAKKEGINFEFLKSPVSYNGSEKVESVTFEEFVLGSKDLSGRPMPIKTGKTITENFSKVILAIGQTPDFSWLEKEKILTNKKTIIVDESYKTSVENVYAAGDCVTGPKTIGEATKTGLAAAKSIINDSKKHQN